MFKKLSEFLKIISQPDKPKHSKKTMIFSLAIYLLILFIVVLLISILFIFLCVSPFLIYLTWHYIKLWKYHGYSVLLLLGTFCMVIAAAILVSPIFKTLLSELLLNFGVSF